MRKIIIRLIKTLLRTVKKIYYAEIIKGIGFSMKISILSSRWIFIENIQLQSWSWIFKLPIIGIKAPENHESGAVLFIYHQRKDSRFGDCSTLST